MARAHPITGGAVLVAENSPQNRYAKTNALRYLVSRKKVNADGSSNANPGVRVGARTDPDDAAASAGLRCVKLATPDYFSSSTPISSSPQTLTYCAFPIVPGPFGPIS